MNIFAKNHVVLKTFSLILTISLLLGLLFSAIFYYFPLQNQILTIFANISLGVAVLCGAYYLTVNTYRFPLKALIWLILIIAALLSLFTLVFGSFQLHILIQKFALITAAAICGAIFGRL